MLPCFKGLDDQPPELTKSTWTPLGFVYAGSLLDELFIAFFVTFFEGFWEDPEVILEPFWSHVGTIFDEI